MMMDHINKEIHDIRHQIQAECGNSLEGICRYASSLQFPGVKFVHLTPQTPFAKTA